MGYKAYYNWRQQFCAFKRTQKCLFYFYLFDSLPYPLNNIVIYPLGHI